MSTTAGQQPDAQDRARMAKELRRLAATLDNSSSDSPSKKIVEYVWIYLKHAARRLGIWFFSLFVAFYVPIRDCGIPLVTASDWTGAVMKNGKFNDVFLGVVAMTILSITDLVDGVVLQNWAKTDAITKGSVLLLLALYFLFIFYGMPLYAGPFVGSPPWVVLLGILGLGLLGELIIAKSAT